jgi:hypothetical protein
MSNETESSVTTEGGHPLLWSIAAILLLTLIAVIGSEYRERANSAIVATAPLDSTCLLNSGKCIAILPNGGSASFVIAPNPIIATTPMQLSLTLEGIEARNVEVHFRGESMNMGLNQFTLTHQAGGDFSGEAILPVCVRNTMMWIADVQVATPQGKVVFPFRFETRHP